MSITLAEARPTEAAGVPQRLSFKSAETSEAAGGQVLGIDDALGVVTAIVSVTGIVDEVDDIIVPGAYRETLMKRRPKVCWAHSWEHPIGKVLEIEELLPGDRRLPSKARDGQSWPAAAGALVAKMQFNLRTDEGKNAFEVVRFYSDSGECEYSIGYNVPPGRSQDVKGIRMIKMLELYELSVVLFGAHTMTGTLDVKSSIAGLGLAAKAIRGTSHGKGIDLALLAVEAKAKTKPEGKAPVPPQFQQGGAAKPAEDAKPKVEDIDPAKVGDDDQAKPEDGEQCTCCSGTGEHDDGHECYVCDAAGTLAAQSEADDAALQPGDSIVCKGHHGRPDDDPDVDHGVDAVSPDAAPEGTPTVGEEVEPTEDAEAKPEGTDPAAEAEGTDPAAPSGPTDNTRAPVDATNADRAPAAGEDTGGDPTQANAPDFSDGIMVALYPDPAAADAIAAHIAGPDVTTPREELHVTLAYLGKIGSSLLSEQALIDTVTRAVEGQERLTGEVGGIGQFPAGENGTPTYAPVDVPGINLLREQIVGELGDVVANDHGFTPHMTLGYDIGMIDPVPPTPITFDHVRLVYGSSQRHITLGAPLAESKSDGLREAIAGFGQVAQDRKPEVKRQIIQQARQEGRTSLLPDSWALDAKGYRPDLDRTRADRLASLDLMAKGIGEHLGVEVKAEGGADQNRGGAEELREYWLTGQGGIEIGWGTPGDFSRCVVLLSEHMTPERAKGYCANRHKDATGMWPGDRDNKDVTTAVSDTKATPTAPGAKSYPQMPGTFEERQQDIHNALCGQYADEVDYDGNPEVWIDVRGTWEDRVLYGVQRWRSQTNETEHYLARYTVEDGVVLLGEREEVDLHIVPVLAEDDDEDEAPTFSVLDAYPFAESVMDVANSFKSALIQQQAMQAVEAKAGRVLSGANERALREAFQHLANIMSAAGIDLGEVVPEHARPVGNDGNDGDQRREMDQSVDTTTTTPLATTKGLPSPVKRSNGGEVLMIDMSEHNALLAAIEAETA